MSDRMLTIIWLATAVSALATGRFLEQKFGHFGEADQNVIIIGNNGRYATEPRQVCADIERKSPNRIVLSVRYPGSCTTKESRQ